MPRPYETMAAQWSAFSRYRGREDFCDRLRGTVINLSRTDSWEKPCSPASNLRRWRVLEKPRQVRRGSLSARGVPYRASLTVT